LALKTNVTLTGVVISMSVKVMMSRSVGDIVSLPKRKAFKVSNQK
jgi:hypothetical protein